MDTSAVLEINSELFDASNTNAGKGLTNRSQTLRIIEFFMVFKFDSISICLSFDLFEEQRLFRFATTVIQGTHSFINH